MFRVGIKQAERYKDVHWLMEIIDAELCLSRLGIKITKQSGDNWEGYCPDHRLFRGCDSSDPRWYINIKSGETICMTEGRGSNLLYTAARLLKKNNNRLTTDDCESAIRFLTGRDCSDAEIAFLKSKSALVRLNKQQKDPQKVKKTWVQEINDGISGGYLSPKSIRFFLTPPDKPPTNITIETLKHYEVFEKTSGYYCNRAIIPIKQGDDVSGFVAVDILGKKRWMETHPTEPEKAYRKTLYPSSETGFFKKDVLFGINDCRKGADYIILTEGAREVMKLWQEGFPDSVAILGSFLSDEQLMILTKLAPKKLVLLFDGDCAGRNIARNIYKRTKELFKTEIINLPEGVDPKQLSRDQLTKFLLIETSHVSIMDKNNTQVWDGDKK